MPDKPLVSKEVFQLNSVEGGLRPGTISFKTVTMESDKFVCVRDVKPDGQTSLIIVDIEQRTNMRHNIKDAEAAIMNPNTKILALRQGENLQVFNLDVQTRIKSCTMSEPVVFWKWVNATIVAIVTNSAVFHWSIADSTSNPNKVFDRPPEMDASVQILNYRADEKLAWLMLMGVAKSPEGALVGKTLLHSTEKGASRVLDGHSGSFIMTALPNEERKCNVMSLSWNNPAGGKMMVMELPTGDKTTTSLERKVIPVNFTSPQDFPVGVNVSPRHKLLTMITSRGMAYLMDLFTGTLIATEQVCSGVIFMAVPSKSGGMMCVSNQGSVFEVSVNDSNIARFIHSNLQNAEMAIRVASSAGLGGVDDLFRIQLQNLLQQQNIDGAVKLVATSPPNVLRNAETLQRFMQTPPPPGQGPPVSTYFKGILAVGKLNAVESTELAKVVVQKGGTGYIKQLFEEDKLEYSEELGDVLSPHDPELAMKTYHKCNAHHKVVNVLLGRNDSTKAVQYCKRVNYSPDWRLVLMNLIRVNPQEAVGLALMLHNDMGDEPLIKPNDVVDMFMPGGNVKQITQFLVEILQNSDTPENGPLQTRLLEINLKHSSAQVAERIFAQNMCSHFEPMPIAQLCERAGLYQRAIECYNKVQVNSNYEQSMMGNIKRCLAQPGGVNPDWLVEFFGKLNKTDSLECIEELMGNLRQNFNVIVQVATRYNNALEATNLIDLFLKSKAYEVLYYYLGSVVQQSTDPEVHFRYIEAAAEVNQMQEVERMTRESPCYDAIRTKNYLKEKRLPDLWPLINVCDQHDYIEELVRYLLDTNNSSFVEQFVQRRSPLKTPAVVGALLDCDASEDFIKTLLNAVGSMCPTEPLVEEVERRGRLRIILPWLEARKAENQTTTALHNALAKVFVDMNQNAQEFLEKNEYYDPMVLGKYCENRDPMLSFIAYSRGNCHEEILNVTTQNGMWKHQAKYLVGQQNPDLWHTALSEETPERKSMIEAVQQSAISESTQPEEVSTTVRAFLRADLQMELAVLLDKIVMHGAFRNNRYLQNLLLMTAIKTRQDKVMEYVNALEDYDAQDIATIATGAELHEVAFALYSKSKLHKHAIRVLIENLKMLPRARSYAEEVDKADAWSEMGVSLLKMDEVSEAIECLIRAKNPDHVGEVCEAAERTNQFGDLIKYLNMARVESKVKDVKVDTYLVLTYAKTGRLTELEDFLKTSHGVKIIEVADKCFNDKLFDSARVLYTAASNFPKLASTFIALNNLSAAVDAAQKAQKIRTWKEVNIACVQNKEMKLAQICAVNIVAHAEELPEFVQLYESLGLWEDLISVLKSAMSNPSAHRGLPTELGVLYAKYKPEKLMEHVKLFVKRINVHRMINACELYHHWPVLRFLHISNEDWLAATQCMIEHAADCWDHETFKDVLTKLGASDLVYQAISFYVQQHPEQLHDLLMTVVKKVDPERVMNEVSKQGPVVLVRPFLEATQDRNLRKVNDTLNKMYLEEEDYKALRNSVEGHNNFDSAALATQLEKHELYEFRRIALALHRKNRRFFHAIEVAKANKLYQDAMETAAESADKEIVEKLLRWFVDNGLQECFAACLYACYDHVDPDVVLEVAWRNKMMDCAMPYLIQVMKDYTDRLKSLETSMASAQKSAQETAAMMQGPNSQQTLMITGAGQQGFQQPPQGQYY